MQLSIPSKQLSLSNEGLKRKIKRLIFTNAENGIPNEEIFKLKEELYFYSALSCSKAKKYFSIICCISYLRSTSDSFMINFNNVDWREAISNIETYIQMNPHSADIREYDDAAMLCKSAQNLIKMGASISLEGGRLIVKNPDFIENKIIQITKNVSIFSLYEHMLADLLYHNESNRLMYKQVMVPISEILPYNYLIRNSKNCTPNIGENNSEDVEELIALASDFIAIHYPFNHVPDISPPSQTKLKSKEYISSIINQYNYYHIKQSDIKYVISLIDFLQDNLAKYIKLSNFDLDPIKKLAIIIRDNSDKKTLTAYT